METEPCIIIDHKGILDNIALPTAHTSLLTVMHIIYILSIHHLHSSVNSAISRTDHTGSHNISACGKDKFTQYMRNKDMFTQLCTARIHLHNRHREDNCTSFAEQGHV